LARGTGISRILFSEALTAEGEVVFAKACERLEGIVSKREGSLYKSGQLAGNEEPEFCQAVTRYTRQSTRYFQPSRV
jgi:hypothetical protein